MCVMKKLVGWAAHVCVAAGTIHAQVQLYGWYKLELGWYELSLLLRHMCECYSCLVLHTGSCVMLRGAVFDVVTA